MIEADNAAARASEQKPTPRTCDEIIADIKMLIAERLKLGVDAADVTADTPLLEGGLALDSIVIVELMAVVEEHFAFTFDDEDLEITIFETPRALATHILRATSSMPSQASHTAGAQ